MHTYYVQSTVSEQPLISIREFLEPSYEMSGIIISTFQIRRNKA